MDNNYKHIVLKFDRAVQPRFEEKKGKGWVEFGELNNYPKYLIDLYNESPKHGAIVKSKVTYIYGKGFEDAGLANSRGESWNAVMKKCIKDDELFRGYFLQVIWNRIGQIAEVYHIDFAKVRVSKDLSTYYVKNDWLDYKEKPREYPAFNTNEKYGSQILYVKEYNSTSEVYPLPSYFQGLNYIESDIEVSRHILGNAKQGFVGSTLINLNNGMPHEEKQGEVERSLLKKFTGHDGKRVVIMFNPSRENSADIQNLGTTMLTKEDFTNINNLIQQEIFASHQIVSPALMGIKTEGQLGSRSEIRDSYEIFNNTYVQERQAEFNEMFTQLRNLKGEAGEFTIQPVEPLKFEFTENIMSQNLSKDEIRQLMGREPLENAIKTQAQVISDNINSLSPLVANKVLESMTPDEIRSLAGLVPAQPSGVASAPQSVPMESNEAIRNLTGRQYQNVMRIVRQFGNGKLSKAQASLMLKNGFGFTDADVNTFLGIDDDPLTEDEIQKFSMDEDARLIQEFSECGASDFEEVKYQRGMFADELNQAQANVLDLIQKDKNITVPVIAKSLKLDQELVQNIIDDFIEGGILKTTASAINETPVFEVLKPLSELGGKQSKVTELFIRYTYEWMPGFSDKDSATSRPFCKELMRMSGTKTWSRSDIESISARVGYSVWERRGGWYTNPRTDVPREYCRHRWVSKLYKRK
jgi:DNA-binding Lrp family transcriptional regulator